MSFQNYRLRKTWLVKCLKSHVLEDPSTEKIANGSKHCCDLNDSTSTIFMNHSVANYVGNSLF